MYRDRLKPKPEFIDYASAAAWLTSMGSSFRGVAEVINRSSAAVVGRWAWVDGVIRPIGPIDFTAVTATQGATIGSVTGQVLDLSDSTFVVTGGYVLRIWNTTDGAAVEDVAAGSWTRSGAGIDAGAAVAAAVAALIAGGKSIRCWVEGLSELPIGGAGSAIRLCAGVASFSDGLILAGKVEPLLIGEYRRGFLRAGLASYVLANDGDVVEVGWSAGAGSGAGRGCGIAKLAGAESFVTVTSGVPTAGASSVDGIQDAVVMGYYTSFGTNDCWRGGGSLGTSSNVSAQTLTLGTYSGKPAYINATNAKISSLKL